MLDRFSSRPHIVEDSMITRTLPLERRGAPIHAGAGVLALVLSVTPVSFAQSQVAPVASPTNAAPASPQPAPAATGVQAERAQVRTGQAPAGSAPGTAAPSTPAPAAQTAPAQPAQPPAAQTAAAPAAGGGETTRASAEADAANRDMQAELEPTPGGLTADEVIRAAFENSPQLAKADLELNRAAANEARARLAFAPRLDVAAGYTRLSKVDLEPFDLSGLVTGYVRPEALRTPAELEAAMAAAGPQESPFTPVLNQYSVSATVSLPITEIFLTIIPTYKATKQLAKVSELQRDAQKLQLSYDARVAFYEYARLRGSAAVARASVRVREAGVRDLESLVQAGTATQTELVRATAELASAKVLETQALGGVEVALARLEQLTGTRIDPARGVGEPFIGIEIGATPSTESVRNEAKASRPELLALNTLVKARQALLRARKGAQYPKIVGRGSALYASPNPRYVPPTADWHDTYEAGIAVSWSPNDFALAYVQATDAETDLKTVYEDQRAFEQGIVVESASAVTGHRTAAETISSTQQALEAARRYEADQRALLLAGAATPNDVLLAQRDLLAASLNWVNAFIAGRIAQAALLKAQGKTGLAN
jgi:outer membrane protein